MTLHCQTTRKMKSRNSKGKHPRASLHHHCLQLSARKRFGPGKAPRHTWVPHLHTKTESTSSASRDLFDPSRPRYPRQDVLLHLSEIFIQLFRTNLCPWVQSEVLLEGARNATLPAILANSVCAMTARFSDWAELRRKSPKNAGEPFSEMAKTLIVPMLSWPSLDVIEALILLSYAEFGAGSDSGLWMYSGMGMRMATDLGLQHESTIRSLPKAEQEKARWLFWSGCYAIDRITCFGTGRPVTLLEHTIDCRPPRVEPGSQCFYASQIIQLLQRRGRMGELLNRKDDSGQINLPEKKAKLMEMWQECAGYFQSLPSTCAFSVQSFKRAASNNEGPAFLFLHVLFQSTISLLERPGIMRGRNWSDVHPVSGSSINLSAPSVAHISASASRSIADMIALAAQVDPKSLQTSPYLDQLILPTGRAFHGELEAIKEAMRQYGYGAEQSRAVSPSRSGGPDDRLMTLLSMRKAVTDNLHNCINWLGTLAHYWGGASWPARALEQEAAGASDIVPDERDDDAMQAPLRDMELLSAWARDKMKQAKSKMASRRGSVDHTRGGSSGSASGTSGGAAAANAAAAAGVGGELAGMGSANAATSIENLLAAANAARDPGGEDDRDVMDSDRALGLALSGQLATSAEINVSALVDLWTEEQRRGSLFSSNGDVNSTFGRGDGAGNAAGGGASRGGMSPWADAHMGNQPSTPGHRSGRGQNLASSGQTPSNHHSSAAFLPPWLAPSPHASNQHHQQQQHSSHLGSGPSPGYGSSGGPFSNSTSGNHHHHHSHHYGNPTSHSAPTMGFSALQLEELLSADLLSSGNDVFPLELPDEALFLRECKWVMGMDSRAGVQWEMDREREVGDSVNSTSLRPSLASIKM
ncbi:hypothetical protein BCV69DRAFT_165108 [Microstroma glucosiphilum]|uniref:Xylanolytic transcriptional activator regulatory domain-containing protein n=1 Tax=Pseudomicrostroma glucosiphilum TaxID=1684307 RepID=A0A316U8W8_9BASI|nr:hypothetical protein BCV69DRAFT_165108 [Pseudomicrostroma glucosiphilum]PWN21278.1 hypothetical protein BCV69DRAFT_165108 [Pseudomicrostroma glucosiphilum]